MYNKYINEINVINVTSSFFSLSLCHYQHLSVIYMEDTAEDDLENPSRSYGKLDLTEF